VGYRQNMGIQNTARDELRARRRGTEVDETQGRRGRWSSDKGQATALEEQEHPRAARW